MKAFRDTKIWATSSLKHVCIHKQDLHLAQQGISNQSRARQVQFGRNKNITHDLALASREWITVLIILIQVSQINQNKLPTFIFQSIFISSNSKCQGLKAYHALFSNEAKPMPKDNQKLKTLVSVMHSLAQVLTSAKWAIPKARSVWQAIPPGSFPSISRTVQAILSDLDHFKYELLNEKPH